jgi:hypothetical protein
MNRPMQTLLAGVVLAALVVAAGAYNHHRLIRTAANAEAETPKLEAASHACFKRYEADHPHTHPGIPLDWLEAEVSQCGNVPSATQIEEQLQADLRRSDYWTRRAAIVVLAVLATPWLWYFLLRRIAELRAAILGNPPAL